MEQGFTTGEYVADLESDIQYTNPAMSEDDTKVEVIANEKGTKESTWIAKEERQETHQRY